MEFQEILNNIDEAVIEYKSGAYLTKDRLRDLLRVISTNKYFLTKINIEAYERWTELIYTRKNGESVASAKTRADANIPELRYTRKILEASNNVIMSIQQELSILKNE